jgi:outer membrane receptor for ferrienterochelin and colicin
MYGQAPWIINASVSYENKKHLFYTNLNFNAFGPKLSVVTKGNTPDIYEQSFPLLNLSVEKNITNRVSMNFAIENILNAYHTKTYTFKNKHFTYQKYSIGRTFSISLKYNIK